jgi:hypothetical protein
MYKVASQESLEELIKDFNVISDININNIQGYLSHSSSQAYGSFYGKCHSLLKKDDIFVDIFRGDWGLESSHCGNDLYFNQILSTFRFIEEEKQYGIFGDSEFDTIVSGYLEIKEVEGLEGSKITNAYFVITEFYEEELRESIEEGIERGNSVNLKENGFYKFNLGCFKDGRIEGVEYEKDKVYMDDETMEKILNSSRENPISIVLYFGLHGGFGCVCCNLAHQVRVYEE